MSGPKMIADRAFTYAGKVLKPGDEFMTFNHDHRILTAMGRAHIAPKVVGGAYSAPVAPMQTKAPHPLDHDGDGKPGGSVPKSPVTLKGKNRAALLKIAEDEGVEIPADVTNGKIIALIEAARGTA